MVEVGYTSEAIADLVKNPQNRIEKVRPAVEKLGGKLHEGFFSFGDYDVIAIGEFPNNVGAAALAMAFSAGGACRCVKTTPLMTGEEAVEAMRKAGGSGYQPPKT